MEVVTEEIDRLEAEPTANAEILRKSASRLAMSVATTTSQQGKLEKILHEIAKALDISDELYQRAERRYKSVARHLERDESKVRNGDEKPRIYTQGSFALGTVVRPLSDADEYDIDLVCVAPRRIDEVSQQATKESVDHEVKDYARANNIKAPVDISDKCATLVYADTDCSFMLDIIAALPDTGTRERLIKEASVSECLALTAIGVADRARLNYSCVDPDWHRGNPKGYSEWFKLQMVVRQRMLKEAYAKGKMALAAEDVPDYKVKTPLQQSVQILKRHRDTFFKGEYKPSSIILTTLAAHAYRNEASLVEAIEGIVHGMENYVTHGPDGEFWVQNPVDPTENFADSWVIDPVRRDRFYEWLSKLKEDWELTKRKSDNLQQILEGRLGQGIVKRAFHVLNEVQSNRLIEPSGTSILSKFDVPWRQKPIWPVASQENGYYVRVVGKYSYSKANGMWIEFQSDCSALDKYLSLRFFAETNVAKPYEVYWQIVNTGDEATQRGQLRGEFNKSMSSGAGGLTSTSVLAMRNEHTEYSGMHWVECFIVKNGILVARSHPYVVNIK